ncbi:MAG: carboxypeptidase regulatory-like domain-containing protein [Bacteroidales bacterium]|nr:carboxypeptidase regulatory-like domain-containing protein [Bacteroidales bacterium]
MKINRLITQLFILILISGNLSAQQDLQTMMRERGEYFFSLNAKQDSEIQFINSICSVAKIENENIICYANQKQYDNLLKLGYQPNLLLPPSMQNEVKMWNGRGTYDWDTYPTYGQYASMMQNFATEHPDRCTYFELGTLQSGHKLMFCRINNGQPEGKPKFLYTSTIHGDEVTGMMLMLRFLDELCTSNDERILNIINNIDLFICPCTNPDGTYHGGDNTVSGATRNNGNNVNLNRNYPDFVDGPHPDANPYQEETLMMMQLADEYKFTMAATFHGGNEVVNYPWDNYHPLTADDAWWQLVSREYADLCHEWDTSYMDGFHDGIIHGVEWYPVAGGRQDYMNYYQECREVTIECSMAWMPSSSMMPTYWNYNHNSIISYLEEVLYGIHGTVTDSLSGQPIVGATVTIEGHDHHGSSVTSHEVGDYHRPIKGGTYQVTYSANGYYPKTITLSVNDHETVIQDIKLLAGENIIPNFEANQTNVAIGQGIDFTDLTWGANLTNWEWQFEGGTPSFSNEQNPTGIYYSDPGNYDVTLTVTNAEGQSESITKHAYITVAEAYLMHNGTISTCNAIFYDSGGAENPYQNGEDYTMTFLPSSENARLEIDFINFKTEANCDKIFVYDGTSLNAPLIGSYSGNHGPGTVTATNPEGALTFRFISDGLQDGTGWTAQINCIPGLSINENTLQNVSVYPNPTKGNFSIACENDVNYTLYNSLGQEIITGEILNGKAEIDAQNLQKGVYFLRLSNETASSVQKIVVE